MMQVFTEVVLTGEVPGDAPVKLRDRGRGAAQMRKGGA